MSGYTIGTDVFSPFSVGFEQLFDRLGQIEKTTQAYPPHNIIRVSEDKYLIELAVAGLRIEDIDIVVQESTLTITYDKKNKDTRDYAYRGISMRSFTKEFTLSEYVHVGSADMSNGILTIELNRVVPDEKKPRKIAISDKRQLLLEHV